MQQRTLGILEISVAAALFGAIPLIVKASSLDALSLSFGRILFATIALAGYVLFWKKVKNPLRKDPVLTIVFGLLHALIIVTSFIAVKLIPISIAILLVWAGVIYLVPMAAFFLGEKITKSTIIATFLALSGLITLFFNIPSSASFWGYVSGAVSGICMAVVYIIGKILSHRHDRVSLTFYQNLIALPVLLPLIPFIPQIPSSPDIGVTLLLGVVCTAIPFILLYSGMRKVSGQTVGFILLLEILFPLVLSFLIFKEVPALREAVGGLLILAAFVMVAVPWAKKPMGDVVEGP